MLLTILLNLSMTLDNIIGFSSGILCPEPEITLTIAALLNANSLVFSNVILGSSFPTTIITGILILSKASKASAVDAIRDNML